MESQSYVLPHHSLTLSGISELWSLTRFKARENAVSLLVGFLGDPCISTQTHALGWNNILQSHG